MQWIGTDTRKAKPIQEIYTNTKKGTEIGDWYKYRKAIQFWKTVQEKISNSSQPSRKELFVKQVSVDTLQRQNSHIYLQPVGTTSNLSTFIKDKSEIS